MSIFGRRSGKEINLFFITIKTPELLVVGKTQMIQWRFDWKIWINLAYVDRVSNSSCGNCAYGGGQRLIRRTGRMDIGENVNFILHNQNRKHKIIDRNCNYQLESIFKAIPDWSSGNFRIPLAYNSSIKDLDKVAH